MGQEDSKNAAGDSDISKKLQALVMSFAEDQQVAKREHTFWSTQPVPQSESEVLYVPLDGPLLPAPGEQTLGTVTTLPAGLAWDTTNLDDEERMREVYELLRDYYVEDVDSQFRFHYHIDFLRWALLAPGYVRDWHLVVRDVSDRSLVAFISASATSLRVRRRLLEAAKVNFLCVRRSLRSKGLAPLLIKEITRRVNVGGIHQAIYTAGVKLPQPISTARYFHRPLNVSKLIRCGFCGPDQSSEETFGRLQSSLSPLLESDVCEANLKLHDYLSAFDLFPCFTDAEFKHMFMSRENVIHSFVKRDGDNNITDFVSLYSVSTSVIGKEETIKIAYLYYYFSPSAERLKSLIAEVLQKCSALGFDVFNALDNMNNSLFFSDLDFVPGDGQLNYYLFNWRTSLIDSKSNGFVLF